MGGGGGPVASFRWCSGLFTDTVVLGGSTDAGPQ